MDIMKRMSNLIKDPDLERLDIEMNTPNFFQILKVERKEIRHSNFLAWLLDPNGSHGLSELFTKWFLRDIFSNDKVNWMTEFDVEDLNFNQMIIKREWRSIDVLIEMPEFIVAIENKVDSGEHSDQLRRYRETVKRFYPDRKHAFVFLSPTNLIPVDEEDSQRYIIYSYENLRRNIEILLDVNTERISEKVGFYLKDYLTILRRDIMKDHESIELAKKLYQNHKEAFDFIFENRPDQLSEAGEIVKRVIEEEGYHLCACNKGYARFLPKSLVSVIPRNGRGWSSKESFLFEVDYWPKKISMRAIIAPGNESTREALIDIISRIEGAKIPRGKQFLSYFSVITKIDVTAETYEDEEKLAEAFRKFLRKNDELIGRIEKSILENKNIVMKK
ncbi:PD-(D/E)XK nuclease family protein [Gottschalkiaceae bacterium SANA]|nr:PD-(D/E)XK nuclease family protein [Gottschalkiaceae bacterium SANA]